jgi:hypothetical protein
MTAPSTDAGAAADASPRLRRPRRRALPGPKLVVSRAQADRYIGSHIDAVLQFQGLRRPWLAEQMGYDQSALSLVLNGKRRITPSFVISACWALRVPPSVLFIERDRARRPADDDDDRERHVAD